MNKSAATLPSRTRMVTPKTVAPSSSVAENDTAWRPTCPSVGVQLNVVEAVPVPLASGAVAPAGSPEAVRATAWPSESVAVTVKLSGLPKTTTLLVPVGSKASVGG